ncbi:MAG: hypothetical protein H7Z76_07535 [Methylotenera sp.]|nr:hypothetical protein [Flavobacterium sp.]
MNITDSIAKTIGGEIEALILSNTQIQFYANDNLSIYQWRDSRFKEKSDVWGNKKCETRSQLIDVFKEHLHSVSNRA